MTKRILKLGFPTGLAVFFEVSIFSTGAIVPSPLGENAIAAHQIAISVTSQLFMIPLIVGNRLNHSGWCHVLWRKNWLAMRQVQKVGLISATIFAACTMALIALARPYIVAIYTNDVHIMPIAMYLLWFAIAYQLVDGWQVSAAGRLRGMQDTQAPMWITLMAYWVIAFPIGLYLARYTSWGVAGVWLGLIIGLTIACVLLIGAYI
ncbi:MAG: MATE family efflux transporter [Acinetobacter sp.]